MSFERCSNRSISWVSLYFLLRRVYHHIYFVLLIELIYISLMWIKVDGLWFGHSFYRRKRRINLSMSEIDFFWKIEKERENSEVKEAKKSQRQWFPQLTIAWIPFFFVLFFLLFIYKGNPGTLNLPVCLTDARFVGLYFIHPLLNSSSISQEYLLPSSRPFTHHYYFATFTFRLHIHICVYFFIFSHCSWIRIAVSFLLASFHSNFCNHRYCVSLLFTVQLFHRNILLYS